MHLRSFKERFVQSALFEVGGILLAGPLYALAAGQDPVDGYAMIGALALVVLFWSPVHNHAFDLIEAKATGRLASDRPRGLRLVHAISHEATSTIVTMPLIVLFGGQGVGMALIFDIGLTVFYTGYAFAYFRLYDAVCPVRVRLTFTSCRVGQASRKCLDSFNP